MTEEIRRHRAGQGMQFPEDVEEQLRGVWSLTPGGMVGGPHQRMDVFVSSCLISAWGGQ